MRPDIGSAKRHQIVDIHAPGSQAADRQERLSADRIGRAGDCCKIKVPIDQANRQLMTICRFLAGEAELAEPRDSEGRDRLRRDRYIVRAAASETCCSRMMRTSVGYPGRRAQSGGIPNRRTIAARSRSRAQSASVASRSVAFVS
jgi:hypothetical protein